MLLFFMAAVLYTIRWYKNQTLKNILITALFIGLAMMTKVSGSIIALFTGPVFLAVLIRRLRQKQAKPLLSQFAAFGSVSAALGLWYPIRNAFLFGQPFGYVLRFPDDSDLYCGGRTFVERFFSFPLGKTINTFYCVPRGDYNIWVYILKCSIFGEYKFAQSDILAAGLIAANLILILVSLAAMVYVMARAKEIDKFARFGLFFIWLVQMGAFILFNIQYPFGCTMDFSYIVPTAIVGAIYIGIALDRIKNKQKSLADAIFIFGCITVAMFGAASVLFYAA
jgi:4-amino-4-deoxy-L-arabinose transferase-like glycosyltransferase